MKKSYRYHRRGQSLVEFALILPIFLILVMGIFDLGRVVYYYSAIHNAAREGVRYGSVQQCDIAGIEDRARHLAAGLEDALVIPSPIFETEGGVPAYIIVTVEYTFEPVTPLIGVFLGSDGSITLRSKAISHIELPGDC